MRTIYKYNNQTYYYEQQVRRAIDEAEGKAFPAEPDGLEARVEFWAELNVEYSEEPDPEPSIDEVRRDKLRELNDNFEWATKNSHCTSSLGFEVDANETADRNVQRLIQYFPVGVETLEFCDYYNVMHDLNKGQLEVIGQEIVINGQNLYQQKWSKRGAINAAETIEEIRAVNTDFEYMNFAE